MLSTLLFHFTQSSNESLMEIFTVYKCKCKYHLLFVSRTQCQVTEVHSQLQSTTNLFTTRRPGKDLCRDLLLNVGFLSRVYQREMTHLYGQSTGYSQLTVLVCKGAIRQMNGSRTFTMVTGLFMKMVQHVPAKT